MKPIVVSRALMVSVKVLSTLGFSVLLYFFLFAWPWIVYRIKSPTSARECALIKAGMTVQEVDGIFRRRTPPRELHRGAGQIISRREDGGCFIQLDAAEKSVREIRFDPSDRPDGFEDFGR